MMINRRLILTSIIIILIGIIGFCCCVSCSNNKPEEIRYELQKLNDEGIYAITYSTHSTAPAYNYEVIIICYGDQIHEFKGRVNICFTKEKPYALIKDSKYKNNDEITVYIPFDSVEYRNGVNIK